MVQLTTQMWGLCVSRGDRCGASTQTALSLQGWPRVPIWRNESIFLIGPPRGCACLQLVWINGAIFSKGHLRFVLKEAKW